MRWGLISDIHGNAVALRECLRRLDALGLDRMFFLGDAVGYMPGEREVVAMLEDRGLMCQQGNHEAMMLCPDARAEANEPVYRLKGAAARLGREALGRIASWPQARELEADGARVLMVHGSPDHRLDGYVYADADWSAWRDVPHDVVFMGHTHRPFVTVQGGKLFANVGSVGLPRDRGDLGCFAVYDTRARACRLYRFRFDVDEVLRDYGDGLDASVRECLRRPCQSPVGEILDE